ncbi:hypothetical protein C001_02832 [Brucella sp. F5/06]|nr:hypothetical protein C001_02832 [Brucella sp. F5/06]
MIYVRELSVNLQEIVSQHYVLIAFFMTSGTGLAVRFDTFCGQKKAHRSELLISRCVASVGRVIGILYAIEVTLCFRDVQCFKVPLFE